MHGSLSLEKYGLERQLRSKVNQFNLVRLFLAILVTFDHAGLIVSGQPGTEPLKLFGLSVGYLAVNGFFVMSGILIAKSLQDRGVSAGYFVSRLLRLYPALIALCVVSIFIIGPLVAKGPYWTGLDSLSYAAEVLRFGNTSGAPNSFYPENPLANEFDSPLWTLRYELLCYLTAPFFIIFGLHKRWLWVLALMAVLGLAIIALPPSQHALFGAHAYTSILRFAFSFGLGILVWSLRTHVKGQLHWVVIASLGFVAAFTLNIGVELMGTLWICSIILYLGLRLPTKRILHTDLSYGIYIWHFPIMQIALGEAGLDSWQTLWLVTAPITLLTAYMSWTMIERPALRFKLVPETKT